MSLPLALGEEMPQGTDPGKPCREGGMARAWPEPKDCESQVLQTRNQPETLEQASASGPSPSTSWLNRQPQGLRKQNEGGWHSVLPLPLHVL